ncbi:MAG: amidohydrolase [Candidatus Thorarchaeota archaeon]|nr:amidohydrolase [Candidatus Thorarchaeota archaeon]
MKAITGATIMCPVQGTIEEGTILFDENGIKAVGKNIEIPKDAEIIDAAGKFVTPGYIDAHTHQGIFDGSIGWAGADGNESVNPITPELRGLDSFNPFEPSLKEVVQGGVTCFNTGPGSANVIGGQAFVIKPTGSGVVDEMVVLAPSGLKVALGENPKRVHGNDKRSPATRMAVAALLRKTFTEGQNYLNEWTAYGEKAREAKKKGEAPPTPPKKNIAMEVIAKVLKREIPLHAHAHRADDIVTIIRIAKEFNIRIVIIHCTEGHKIADFIAEADVPAVVGPTMYWVSKPETRERSFETAVKLVKAGVKVALQTDSLTPMLHFQLLPMYVIKHGLTREEAFRCVTMNPAEILGIEDRVGSLERGKDADIVVWSGDPFDFYSRPEQVFINGMPVNIDD